MNKRGFTFIEILIVMIIIGIIASFGIPRIRDAIQKTNIRAARVGLSLVVVKARQAAIARGCRGVVHITSGSGGTVWAAGCQLTATGNVGTAVDTLGTVGPLGGGHGV